jgi:type II secretory pathway component GspD/PulD (secretin)
VELTLDKLHDFGIELASVKTSAEADYNAFGGALFGMSKITVNADGNYGKVPVPSNVAGMFGGLAYKNDMSLLPLLIIAAKEDRNVSICGQPQIVANDNEEASFESNIQVPTLKTNIGASGEIISQSAEYYTASMLLKIVPHITEENFLRLEIEQNSERFDLATALTNLPPAKTARKTKTTVTIPDRSTVLLGGLKTEDGSWTVKKVPVLGDIPFLRYFFRRQTWTENESTVFVFITATIIRTNEEYETMSSVKLDAIEKLVRCMPYTSPRNPSRKTDTHA